jgi:hypothetical protein
VEKINEEKYKKYTKKKPPEPKRENYEIMKEVECQMCGKISDLQLTISSGGIFFENYDRKHILGVCPNCNSTIISYHITIK